QELEQEPGDCGIRHFICLASDARTGISHSLWEPWRQYIWQNDSYKRNSSGLSHRISCPLLFEMKLSLIAVLAQALVAQALSKHCAWKGWSLTPWEDCPGDLHSFCCVLDSTPELPVPRTCVPVVNDILEDVYPDCGDNGVCPRPNFPVRDANVNLAGIRRRSIAYMPTGIPLGERKN
ncbi:hypothetical protein BUE80_DR003061, partial [Diplocarpon rosae]